MRRAGLIFLIGFLAGTGAALAQEVQFDSRALDATGASAAPARRKGKKVAAPEAQQQPAQGAKAGANRQFGELEGWSPGKEPPKPKGAYDDPNATPASGGKANVSVTPSGSMNVGLPF